MMIENLYRFRLFSVPQILLNLLWFYFKYPSRCSIVVSIPACHAGDPGSLPSNGVLTFLSILIMYTASVLSFSQPKTRDSKVCKAQQKKNTQK